MNGVGCRAAARIMGVGLNTILRHLKAQAAVGDLQRIQPGSDVIVCAEMDEQWGYVGAKSRQRLAVAYDGSPEDGCCARIQVNALWRRWGVL